MKIYTLLLIFFCIIQSVSVISAPLLKSEEKLVVPVEQEGHVAMNDRPQENIVENSVIAEEIAAGVELYEKYRVDDSMKALLDEHKDELIEAFKNCKQNVCIKRKRAYKFSWLPGYVVKNNISRIIGVECLVSAIRKHNLDLIIVPEKKIYKADGYIFIVADKIVATSRQPITLQQVQQLWRLSEATQYLDMHGKNLLIVNDKLAIIDTEEVSFQRNGPNSFTTFAKLLTRHTLSKYTEDAFRFVLENFKRYVPQNSKVLKKKEKSAYRKIYKKIKGNLRKQPDVFKGDYYSYFKEHFPKP